MKMGLMKYIKTRAVASEAGVKRELARSANYPREFGLALAALGPRTGIRPTDDGIDLNYPNGSDHLGSLDDLRKGPSKTWWRKLSRG